MFVQFFECCEHKDWCIGVPNTIYAPWECLRSDPFYSCNDVFRECLRGVWSDQTSWPDQTRCGLTRPHSLSGSTNALQCCDYRCNESYGNITEYCRPEMFSSREKCPTKVPDTCSTHLRNVEGWYCSCSSYLTGVGVVLFLPAGLPAGLQIGS